MRAGRVAGLALLPLLALLVACGTLFESSELKSGLSPEEVELRLGKPPESVEPFVLPDYPDRTMTVAVYMLAQKEGWPDGPHWVLFDANGLVSYGQGGRREAATRVLDSYYAWMADEGQLPRAEAEHRLLARVRELYGADLNPAADAYLSYRAEIMEQVDRDQLDANQANTLAAARFRELYARDYGERAVAELAEMGPEEGRAAALERLGLDVHAVGQPDRPRAGGRRGTISCRTVGGSPGSSALCF